MYIESLNFNNIYNLFSEDEKTKIYRKKILVICGMHGNESNAVKTTLELLNIFRKDLEKKDLKNNCPDYLKKIAKNINEIKFIMGVNRTGLINNVREYVEEENYKKSCTDLNRGFCFKDYEDFEYIIRRIKTEIGDYDIILDIHNSPFCRSAIYASPGNNISLIKSMAKQNNFEYIIGNSLSDGILKNYVNEYANGMYNRLGLTIELNSMGLNDYSKIYSDVDFIKKIIECIGDYDPKEYFDYLKNLDVSTDIISPAEGILYYTYDNPLVEYKKGDVIAVIRNYDYDEVGMICAPYDGKVMAISSSVYTGIGNSIATFQGDNDGK